MAGALVSTIIPVWNRAAMLREAVASVLAQTYRPIEIVIVDDGSTDDTPLVADALAQEHAGIVRAIHVPNGGPGAAREAARGLVRGAYIQHLDSDDVLVPGKFAAQVQALERDPGCGAAYGWTRFRRVGGTIEAAPWKRSGERIDAMFPSMLIERWWDTPTPLYRAEVIAAAGPWTNLRVEEDWEYDCRIAAMGTRLAYCAEWVCEVREHTGARASGHRTRAALRDRADAHLRMYGHARRANLDPSSPEMRFFSRDLFHLARQCGAAGLGDESRRLVAAARAISPARDIRLYDLAGRTFGWRAAATAAAWLPKRGRTAQS